MTRRLPELLSDFVFDENLTKAAVERKWGAGLPYGPSRREVVVYDVGADGELWLTFADDENGALERAITLENNFASTSLKNILYDRLARTKNRSCADIKKSGMTADELFRIWGPPDGNFGSGVDRWLYQLKNNGGEASVAFSNGIADISCD